MELTRWALGNAEKLSVHAEKYSWIGDWLPGFFDYGVIVTFVGRQFSGRGIDKTEETAFEKAVAEALERAAVAAALPGVYCGTAAYPDKPGAKLRAYRELLGIDRVFCHHYTGAKMRRMAWSESAGYFPDGALLRKIGQTGMEFSLYELRPALDARVVCAIAYGGQLKFGGFLSGFGVDADLSSAAAHAVIECLRTVAACLLTDYSPAESLEALKRKGEPRWHFWMAQRPESLDDLRGRLLPATGEDIRLEPEEISAGDITFSMVESLRPDYPDIPLEIACASSDKLIKPQFGDIVASPALIKRLESFAGKSVEINGIAQHFYG